MMTSDSEDESEKLSPSCMYFKIYNPEGPRDFSNFFKINQQLLSKLVDKDYMNDFILTYFLSKNFFYQVGKWIGIQGRLSEGCPGKCDNN